MSNTKYTPMQILRDNIKLKTIELGIPNDKISSTLYGEILEMIEGVSLGKPLLQQEAELLGIEIEEEEQLPKRGTVVWCKQYGGWERWFPSHFIQKREGKYRVSFYNDAADCILVDEITIQNPYENSDISKMENTDREPKIGDMCFFWDNLEKNVLAFGILSSINKESNAPYRINYLDGTLFGFKHCSLKNPLIK